MTIQITIAAANQQPGMHFGVAQARFRSLDRPDLSEYRCEEAAEYLAGRASMIL